MLSTKFSAVDSIAADAICNSPNPRVSLLTSAIRSVLALFISFAESSRQIKSEELTSDRIENVDFRKYAVTTIPAIGYCEVRTFSIIPVTAAHDIQISARARPHRYFCDVCDFRVVRSQTIVVLCISEPIQTTGCSVFGISPKAMSIVIAIARTSNGT